MPPSQYTPGPGEGGTTVDNGEWKLLPLNVSIVRRLMSSSGPMGAARSTCDDVVARRAAIPLQMHEADKRYILGKIDRTIKWRCQYPDGAPRPARRIAGGWSPLLVQVFISNDD